MSRVLRTGLDLLDIAMESVLVFSAARRVEFRGRPTIKVGTGFAYPVCSIVADPDPQETLVAGHRDGVGENLVVGKGLVR